MPTDDAGFTFAATGDSIITRPVSAESAIEPVAARLRTADATMTNLETVVTGDPDYASPPRPISDQYQYLGSFPGMVIRSDPPVLDELDALGVDIFATASNHSYDFGRPGMADTMAALEERGLPYAGMGNDLPEARRPAYVSTPGGRVGMVAACTSVAPGSEAGPPSSLLPGRPGISPLHVTWTYKVHEDRLEQLTDLGSALGIDDVKDTWLKRERRPDEGSDRAEDSEAYDFMHMTMKSVADPAEEGIEYGVHDEDREDLLAQVREADSSADWVVASLHCHQGPDGSRNVQETPAFLKTIARECLDAGADAFVGTGPHVLRGIELYDGKPIFYSLGNFFCQFETMDRLPKQSFEYYGIDDDRYPSTVFDARYYDEEGNPTGNLAYPEYWRSVVPTCTFDADGTLDGIELYPISLGRELPRPKRGTPRPATGAERTAILDTLEELSAPYGTTIRRQDGVGFVDVN